MLLGRSDLGIFSLQIMARDIMFLNLKASFIGFVIFALIMCYGIASWCYQYRSDSLLFTMENPRTSEHQEPEKLGPTISNAIATEMVPDKDFSNQLGLTTTCTTTDRVFSNHNMSVRFGNDLKFEVSHCPSGSYMLDRKQDFIPEHQDCPDLFIAGARKGGTTSLIQYLSKHPDFKGARMGAGPQAGETLYFATLYDRRRKPTWEQYISKFPRDAAMKGDSSVGNLVHNAAPQRIYSACGGRPKIVMLFRDPIKRLVSNFLMRVRLHEKNRYDHLGPILARHLDNFRLKALRGDSVSAADLPDNWSKFVGLFKPHINFLFEGLYYVHLMNWLCNFPAENILIIRSEEFFTNPNEILDIVIQFLGLKRLDFKTYDKITSVSYNSGKYAVPDYQKITQSEEVSLRDIFRPFNKVLFKLLRWNTSSSQWLL